MKNVVLLVIDSLSAEEVNDSKHGVYAMPFLRQLAQHGINIKNFYSQGTHTEAGLPGLMCGVDTLDYNAYLHRFNDSPKMIYDYFHDAGYDIINISWPRNYYPERVHAYIKTYYTHSLIFSDFFYWDLPFYKKIYEKGMLNHKDMDDLIKAYDHAFRAAIRFWDDRANLGSAFVLIERFFTDEKSGVIKLLRQEYEKFEKDPEKYILRDLNAACLSGDLSKTFADQNNVVDREKLYAIEKENIVFLKNVKRKQILENIFDARLDYAEICKGAVRKLCNKDNHDYLTGWHRRFMTSDSLFFHKMNRNREDGVSFKTELDFLLERLLEQKNKKPKLIYIHSGSLHSPVDWVSFDENEECIKKEIKQAKTLIKQTKRYHGDYVYRLGMGYVDHCLKNAFVKFKKAGVLEDTIFVITADHGSSLGSKPIRSVMDFNNCHSELSHIPMIIWGKNIEHSDIDGMYENKDFIPSILELCGIKGDEYLKGHSFFDKCYEGKIAHGERIGSGCPCLEHRDIIYNARNEHYLIEYVVGIYQKFQDGKLTEVYDVIDDIDERKNIKNRINKDEIKDLLEFLSKRHFKLQENYRQYCADINYRNDDGGVYE